jgi:hypothetical protein
MVQNLSYLDIFERPMAKAGKRDPSSERPDGRRPLLVYILPDVVKDLKKAALDVDKNAYEIVEEAVSEWLARRKSKKPKA